MLSNDADRLERLEQALSYPEDSAGRLMSRDFVAVPEHMSVGDLIDFLVQEASSQIRQALLKQQGGGLQYVWPGFN